MLLLVIKLSSPFKNQIYELCDCTPQADFMLCEEVLPLICFNSAGIIAGSTLVWENIGLKWLIFLLKCLGIFVWEQTPGSAQSFHIHYIAFPKSKQNNNHHRQQYQFSKCALKWNVNTLMNSFCSKTACMWPNGKRHCLHKKWAYWNKITLSSNVPCYLKKKKSPLEPIASHIIF